MFNYAWLVENANWAITVIVLLVVVVQSLFGVGALLLGTPILLLFGMPILETLFLLLPVSLSISILQTYVGFKYIQWKSVMSFVVFALPLAVLGTLLLKFVVGSSILLMFIAVYLIFVAVGFYFQVFPAAIRRMLHNEKLFLILMGLIHGLTNMGGPLLSSYVMAKYDDKSQARSTTAICYGFLVIVQLLTLAFSGVTMAVNSLNVTTIFLSLVVFMAVNQFLFFKLSNQTFKSFFGMLLLLMSMLLFLRYFSWY